MQRPKPRAQSRECCDISFAQKISEQRRLKRKELNEYEQSQPREIYRTSVRQISQKASKKVDEISQSYMGVVSQLIDDIYDVVKTKFESLEEVSFEELTDVLEITTRAISTLESLTENPLFKPKKDGLTPIEKLYNKLIDDLDVRFTLIAPERCVMRRDIRYKTLPEDMKDMMFERLKDLGYWNDYKNVDKYYLSFKNQFDNQNEIII